MEAVATAKAAARHTSLQPPERSAQLVELSQLTRDGKFVDSSLERRTFGTSRKEPLSLSLFGGFGPEVSRLCLCDSLPARSVRSQFRRDRRCYTEGAPLR